MTDLNTLLDASAGDGWDILFASDINNAGWIAATAIGADGLQHAVLLTPVPEPETWALMLAGLAAVAASRRRSRSAAHASAA